MGIPVALVILMIAWKLAGRSMRKKGLTPLSPGESSRFLVRSCAAMVALYVIFPVVIESFGHTYPVSEQTVLYVMCLSLASLMMVVYHFVKNRRAPNQQSVCIIILGLLGGAAMMALFAILAMAIAASAIT